MYRDRIKVKNADGTANNAYEKTDDGFMGTLSYLVCQIFGTGNP